MLDRIIRFSLENRLLILVASALLLVAGLHRTFNAEVDQMVLTFPCLSDYALVCEGGVNIYLSHGHRDVPPLAESDVYITGHTHVPVIERCPYLHLNPGSVSLPKEGSERGYIVYENRTFTFKTLAGREYKQVTV